MRRSFYTYGRTPSTERPTLPVMFASSLQMVLLKDGSILQPITLAPWVTYPLLLGAAYGFVRLPWDIVKALARNVTEFDGSLRDAVKRPPHQM